MKLQTIRSLALVLCMGVLATFIQATKVWGQQSPNPTPVGGAAKVIDFDYTKTHSFPNIFDSFSPLYVPNPGMENSPRLHDLIREGKLWLSLEDAIALTLENNLDIDVARFQIPLAQADYLRTRAGSAARGVQGAAISNALFAGAIGASTTSGASGSSSGAGGAGFSGSGAVNGGFVACCDPVAGFYMGWDQNNDAAWNNRPHGCYLPEPAADKLPGLLRSGFHDRNQLRDRTCMEIARPPAP